MLILTRKLGQQIIFRIGGERMAVTVMEIQGRRVSLGFEAPEVVKILREELEGRPEEGR